MDVWSGEERYNHKLTYERISKSIAQVMTTKITEKRVKWYGDGEGAKSTATKNVRFTRTRKEMERKTEHYRWKNLCNGDMENVG